MIQLFIFILIFYLSPSLSSFFLGATFFFIWSILDGGQEMGLRQLRTSDSSESNLTSFVKAGTVRGAEEFTS
jgi:hypothetical protein